MNDVWVTVALAFGLVVVALWRPQSYEQKDQVTVSEEELCRRVRVQNEARWQELQRVGRERAKEQSRRAADRG